MPHNDPDPTDPNVLVGVVLPAERETMQEMAYAFAEEFARMGYDRQQILSLFKNPFYGGAYSAYRALGEERIQTIVDECVSAWGGSTAIVQPPPSSSPATRGRKEVGA